VRPAASLDFQPRKVQGVSGLPGLGAMEWEATPVAEASPVPDAAPVADALPSQSGADSINAGLDAGLAAGLDAGLRPQGSPLCLLRTETSVVPSESTAAKLALSATNPGSVGHPELCTRPCLYYAAGSCDKSHECEFCHLFHSRRPARLDKRHRERLDRLSPAERIAVMLPILAQKAESSGLSPEQLKTMLSKLAVSMPEVAAAEKTKVTRSLKAALEAMSLRSLLTLLDCAPEVPPALDPQ